MYHTNPNPETPCLGLFLEELQYQAIRCFKQMENHLGNICMIINDAHVLINQKKVLEDNTGIEYVAQFYKPELVTAHRLWSKIRLRVHETPQEIVQMDTKTFLEFASTGKITSHWNRDYDRSDGQKIEISEVLDNIPYSTKRLITQLQRIRPVVNHLQITHIRNAFRQVHEQYSKLREIEKRIQRISWNQYHETAES